MAWESPVFNVPGLTASADLSSNQYYCVTKNTSDGQVALASTDGEVILGVMIVLVALAVIQLFHEFCRSVADDLGHRQRTGARHFLARFVQGHLGGIALGRGRPGEPLEAGTDHKRCRERGRHVGRSH